MQLFFLVLLQLTYSLTIQGVCKFVKTKAGKFVRAGKENTGRYLQTSRGIFRKCSESAGHSWAYIGANARDQVTEENNKVSEQVEKSMRNMSWKGLVEKGSGNVASLAQGAKKTTKKVLQKTGENFYKNWQQAKRVASFNRAKKHFKTKWFKARQNRPLAETAASTEQDNNTTEIETHLVNGNATIEDELSRDTGHGEQEISAGYSWGSNDLSEEDLSEISISQGTFSSDSSDNPEATEENEERSIWDELSSVLSWETSTPNSPIHDAAFLRELDQMIERENA